MAARATAVLDRTYADGVSRCTWYAIINVKYNIHLHASVAVRNTAIQTVQNGSKLRLQYQCSEYGIQSISPITHMAKISTFYEICSIMRTVTTTIADTRAGSAPDRKWPLHEEAARLKLKSHVPITI